MQAHLQPDMLTTPYEPGQEMMKRVMWAQQESPTCFDIIDGGYSNVVAAAAPASNHYNTGEMANENMSIFNTFEMSPQLENFQLAPPPVKFPNRQVSMHIEAQHVFSVGHVKEEFVIDHVEHCNVETGHHHDFQHFQSSIETSPEADYAVPIGKRSETKKVANKRVMKAKQGQTKKGHPVRETPSSGRSSCPPNASAEACIASIKSIGGAHKFECFPLKLFNLASDDSFDPIKWTPDGMMIGICMEKMEPLLPHLFRTDKYASFLRQLHLYGFRKEKNSDGVGVALYHNPNFQRDQPALITNISRK